MTDKKVNWDIVKSNTDILQQSIINGSSITDHLKTIENVFGPNLMNRLIEYLGTADIEWVKETGQEDLPRKKVSWDPDTVIEELHQCCNNLTPYINSEFVANGETVFEGVSIWQDSEGYTMEYHTDNPKIAVALQVYIYGAPETCGTSFVIDDQVIDVPFQYNTGYILEQVEGERLLHAPSQPVPAGVERFSLYAVWSRKTH